MTVKSCRSLSAEASTEGPRCEVAQFGVVRFGVVPFIVEERSFEGELLPPAAGMSQGDIVIRAINIAAVAATLAVFIVAVRSQLAVRS